MHGQAIRLICAGFTATLLLCGVAEARDMFDAVRCGQDVATALAGRKSGDEPVAQIEARHRVLGLKNLGGDEISDSLSAASWQICGSEYQVLYNSKQVVRAVLPFPAHTRASPEFSGVCQRNGQKLPGTVVAVLDNRSADVHGASHYSTNDETLLPAKAAWRVDEKAMKFVPLPTNDLRCPRSGIITADGGP